MICLSCSEKSTRQWDGNNRPPQTPRALSPINHSQNVHTDISLTWQCTDPDGDSLKFNIYFGDQPNPPLANSDLVQTTFSPGWLEYQTTYFWMVQACDQHGDTISGPVWSFKTKNITGIELLGSVDIPAIRDEWQTLAVSGNYVFLSEANSPLLIFDVSNPSQPAFICQYGENGYYISQSAVKDQYLFLARIFYGLEIIDISNPPNPIIAGSFQTNLMANTIVLKDNFAFLGTNGGIVALDMSNPANPIPVDTSAGFGNVIGISGDYAYSFLGCEFEESCLGIAEVHNTSFEFINNILLNTIVNGYSMDYRYIFFSSQPNADPRQLLQVYSLVSPSNPQLIYTFPQDSTTAYYAPCINGDLVYTGFTINHISGIKIFSIENLPYPTELASYVTEAPIMKIAVTNNHIYATDYTPRLLVFGYAP
jgi:hypothetical protein